MSTGMIKNLKTFIKTTFPFSRRVVDMVMKATYNLKPMQSRFSEIYRTNHWLGKQSVSGAGSDLPQTKEVRDQLPDLMRKLNVTSLLDAPCGDFHWMKEISHHIYRYIGVDIVPELIEENTMKFGSELCQFFHKDMTRDSIPKVDVILCRDGLVHLSYKDINAALNNFKLSGSTWLLTTTFVSHDENVHIATGRWRPLNLQRPPVNFPEPVELIKENCSAGNGQYIDKCLGLWKLSDLNPF